MLTLKAVIDYIEYLLPYRKTKWGLLIILLPLLVFWGLYVFPLYGMDRSKFEFGSYGLLVISVIFFMLWLIYSHRLILRNKNFTVVLSLKAKDPKSNNYVQDAVSMLRTELDRIGLLDKFRIMIAGTDFIVNREKAHKYRENFDLDLVIWGEVFSGKKDEKELSDFKKLSFTYKIPSQVILANITELFQSDINIALVNREWNIYEFNSLPDLEKVSTNLGEVIMFILGIIYCQSKDYAKDSIIILENLFRGLENRTQNQQIMISPELKTLTISPAILRKSMSL